MNSLLISQAGTNLSVSGFDQDILSNTGHIKYTFLQVVKDNQGWSQDTQSFPLVSLFYPQFKQIFIVTHDQTMPVTHTHWKIAGLQQE